MMKHITVARLLLLGSCLVSTTIALAQQRDERYLMPPIPAFRTSQANLPPEIVLRVQPPEVASELPVFEILPVDPDSLREISKALGVEGREVRVQDGKVTVRGETGEGRLARITIFEASGGFYYVTADAAEAMPEEPPALPPEEEAYNAAVGFLRERGLMPQDALTEAEAVTFARPVVAERDKRTGETLQQFATEIEVRFPQRWGDYPVNGPGSKLYVAVVEGGRISSVTKMWRQARATDTKLESLQPAEALTVAMTQQANATFPVHCATAEVTSFELVYWSEAPSKSQNLGLPVFRIQGTCLSVGGQDLGAFEIYAPAVKGGPVGTPEREAEPVVDPDEQR